MSYNNRIGLGGKLPDVVIHLLIINVLVYLALHYFQNGILFKYLPAYFPLSSEFKWFQPITHMFGHGGPGHLLFNMIGLYFFGPPLARIWGWKKFLFFYISCGLGAYLAYHGINYLQFAPNFASVPPAIGASGAIYGLLAAFAILYPNAKLMLIFLPIPIAAKYFVPALMAIDLFLGLSSMNTGIAHFAHLGGAITGFIMLMLWKRNSNQLY